MMLNIEKLVALSAGSIIVLAASAQVLIPPCCKYLWDWPTTMNPPAPAGACSGDHSYTCQTGSEYVWGDDPLSDAKGPYIQAQCFQVILEDGAEFLRVDCSELAPPGVFIGVLPNGQCCYAVGAPQNIQIFPTPAGYQIRQCEGNCGGSQN